jgi:hypothetical protein
MRPQASQIDQALYQIPKVNQNMPYLSDRDLFSQNTRVPQSQDPSNQINQNQLNNYTQTSQTSQGNQTSQTSHLFSNLAYDQSNQSYLSQFNLNIPTSNQKNMSIFDRTMEKFGQHK